MPACDTAAAKISVCLQILRHEASIGSTETTDFFIVHKRMLLAELLCTFDDIICCTFPPSIDMAGGELLPEAGCPARLDDIYYIIT